VSVALNVTFPTTSTFSSANVHSSQSKKESSTEAEKTGLLYPNENRASFSDASDGPEEDDDKKSIKEDKQKDVKSRLLQQWSNAEAQQAVQREMGRNTTAVRRKMERIRQE
jgi:hypothetical protein